MYLSPKVKNNNKVTKYKLSSSVQSININEDVTALSHSLSLQQIFVKKKRFLYDSKIIKVLQKEEFLITENNCEDNIRKQIIRNANNKELTLLRILLTDLCNLSCKYCKVCHNIDYPNAQPTPIEKIQNAVDALFEKSTKEKVIHITGGEPILFFKQITKIVQYIEDNYSHSGYKYIIIIGTNGILLDKKMADYFKKHDIKIIISLDGKKTANIMRINKNGINSFNETVKGIRLLKKRGIEVGISMVVGSFNITKLDEQIEYIFKKYKPASLGVNFIKNTKAKEKSKFLIEGNVYAQAIYKIHKKYRENNLFMELLARKLFPFVDRKYRLYDCGASNGTTVNIDATGNVGICKSFLLLKTKYSEDSINNIIEDFKTRSPIYQRQCKKCPAQGICGNGCAYEAEFNKGKVIDERACGYVTEFFGLFVRDVFELNKLKAIESINKKGYYIPSYSDRKMILGNVRKDKLSLRQCIGHEI